MQAYKFLGSGRTGPFSGTVWPAPANAGPGPWVEAAEPLEVCRSGVHACAAADLPRWIDEELWTVELGGTIEPKPGKLVAERGRLVARVQEWDGAAADAWHAACTVRIRELAAGAPPDRAQTFAAFAADAEGLAAPTPARRAATAAYIARIAAATLADSRAAMDAERAAQAAWLTDRLGLV